MKISLVDPGLVTLRGHHLEVNRRLGRTLTSLGHDVEIFANRRLEQACVEKMAEAGMRLSRVFRIDAHRRPHPLLDTIGTVHEAARGIVEDLADVGDSDLWFWPTLTPVQFLAAVQVERQVKIAGGVAYLPNRIFQFGAYCWAQAARKAHALGNRVLIGAYDDGILRAYRTMSGSLALVRLPIYHDGAPGHRARTRLERVGLFGDHREERGRSLLPPLVAALLDRGLAVTLQDSAEASIPVEPHPRLRSLGYVDDFAEEMATCDLVIWPSMATPYVLRLSGVVFNAIATGIPVILPSNCTPAEVAREMGSGLFFHHYSCGAILEALDEAMATYPALAQAAARAARRWAEREGSRRLAEAITAR